MRAVIAESFERIHRSNLVGMGVLPLQFADGDTVASLGLDGSEAFSIAGIADTLNAGGAAPSELEVTAGDKTFTVRVRIDTPKEARVLPPRRASCRTCCGSWRPARSRCPGSSPRVGGGGGGGAKSLGALGGGATPDSPASALIGG